MLTRELAIAAYEAGQIKPDRLTRSKHAHYSELAESMLRIYRKRRWPYAPEIAKWSSSSIRRRTRLPNAAN